MSAASGNGSRSAFETPRRPKIRKRAATPPRVEPPKRPTLQLVVDAPESTADLCAPPATRADAPMTYVGPTLANEGGAPSWPQRRTLALVLSTIIAASALLTIVVIMLGRSSVDTGRTSTTTVTAAKTDAKGGAAAAKAQAVGEAITVVDVKSLPSAKPTSHGRARSVNRARAAAAPAAATASPATEAAGAPEPPPPETSDAIEAAERLLAGTGQTPSASAQ
jgi:hypothetical protein